jgi:hypothetical protein
MILQKWGPRTKCEPITLNTFSIDPLDRMLLLIRVKCIAWFLWDAFVRSRKSAVQDAADCL